ncbi:hypothetical protein BC829DRAFT_382855 [Chytridium lagenaria]|nr:hypothetical protein BC829DRAFT_382855 [Chytridium lagenaria]
MVNEHRGRPRIEVDLRAYLERAEDELRSAMKEYQNLQSQVKSIQDEEGQISSKINSLKVGD